VRGREKGRVGAGRGVEERWRKKYIHDVMRRYSLGVHGCCMCVGINSMDDFF